MGSTHLQARLGREARVELPGAPRRHRPGDPARRIGRAGAARRGGRGAAAVHLRGHDEAGTCSADAAQMQRRCSADAAQMQHRDAAHPKRIHNACAACEAYIDIGHPWHAPAEGSAAQSRYIRPTPSRCRQRRRRSARRPPSDSEMAPCMSVAICVRVHPCLSGEMAPCIYRFVHPCLSVCRSTDPSDSPPCGPPATWIRHGTY